MDTLPVTLASFVVLYLIYTIAYFGAALALKVREEHYVLGFGKPLFSFVVRGVRFSVAWFIPLFGLARIRAVVNGEVVKRKYAWEFEHASLLRRLIVTLSGTVALLLAGCVLFIYSVYTTHESRITKESVNKTGISASRWAQNVGFRDKDKIVAVNGKDYEHFAELIGHRVLLDSNTTYTVERNGKQFDLRMGKPPEPLHLSQEPFLSVYVPFEIAFVQEYSPAEEAGLQNGDRIVNVNDTPIVTRMEMIRRFDEDTDGIVTLGVIRPGNEGDTLAISATLNEEKRLGFAARELFEFTEHRNSFGESVKKGIAVASVQIRAVIKVVAGDLAPRTATPVSGPIAINSAFGRSFIAPLAAAAMWYGFYNLLPLPIAAFWEIIPLGYEAITRRKLPYRFFNAGLTVGWCVVIALFLWVFVSDMVKLMA